MLPQPQPAGLGGNHHRAGWRIGVERRNARAQQGQCVQALQYDFQHVGQLGGVHEPGCLHARQILRYGAMDGCQSGMLLHR